MRLFVSNFVAGGYTEVNRLGDGMRLGRPAVHVEAIEGAPFCRQTMGGPAQYRDEWVRPDAILAVDNSLDLDAALEAATGRRDYALMNISKARHWFAQLYGDKVEREFYETIKFLTPDRQLDAIWQQVDYLDNYAQVSNTYALRMGA